MKCADGVALVLADPALVNFMNRNRIQVVQFLAPAPYGDNQIRFFEQEKVLGYGLTTHSRLPAKLAQSLPVVGVEPVEQFPASGIRERLEHHVHDL